MQDRRYLVTRNYGLNLDKVLRCWKLFNVEGGSFEGIWQRSFGKLFWTRS